MAIQPPPEVVPVRPGEELDWPRIEHHVRQHVPGLEGPMEVRQFPNGSANLTYLLRFGDTELVLRRPPFGRIAPGAHDMKREHAVLSRLWRHFDRAPRAYLFCDDHDVAGADFFVMERRVGEVVRGVIPPSMAGHERVGHRIGLAVVDALADLHALDPAACELGDLGRPEGFVARQVTGWRKRWELARLEGAPPLMDEVAARLEHSLPTSARASIVHNDLKLDNCQFRPEDPDRVSTIFDWDMTTLGDPLVDLGTLLNYWPDPSDPPEATRHTHEGMTELGLPSRGEVVARYAERTGADLSGIRWYEAFAQWKTAVVMQQLHTRWVRGETKDERMAGKGERIADYGRSAAALLDGLGV